jgi:hypothetical protein
MINLFALLGCDCPLPTELADIPANSCPENIGQIQRFFIARKGNIIWDNATPANNLPATISGDVIEVVAGWNTLFAAADDTKVIKTPLVGGDTAITAGTAITQGGGDNTTLNGETLVNGYNPADGTARFDSLSTAQVVAMKALRCEEVEVYPINQDGKILARKEGDLITGFPVTNFSLGSKNNAGFGTRDNNVLTFQMNDDWDEYLYFVTPTDFNALTV